MWIDVRDFKAQIEHITPDQFTLLRDSFAIMYTEEVDVINPVTDEVTVEEFERWQHYLFCDDGVYWFYAGIFPQVYRRIIELFKNPPEVVDNRIHSKPRETKYLVNTAVTDSMKLRDDYQSPVVETILEKRKGIIFVPTRGGKTEMLICAVNNYLDFEDAHAKVTIIVRKGTLADNMYKRFRMRGYDAEVGKFYDGNKDYYKQVLICVVNSVNNLLKRGTEHKLGNVSKALFDRIVDTDVLLVDEIQDGAAAMFQYTIRTMFELNHPKIAIACSGTPFMNEKDPDIGIRDLNIQQLFGSVISRVNNEYLIKMRYKARGNVIWSGYRMDPPKYLSKKYTRIYKQYITQNHARNYRAVEFIKLIVEAKQTCLVLVNHLEHGKAILELLDKEIPDARCLFSSANETCEMSEGKVTWSEIRDPLIAFNRRELDVLIGTTIYNVGVDFPECKWLVLLAGEGNENDILNKQRTSRVLSPHVNDNNGYIIDFIDYYHPVTEKHSYSRRDLYTDAKFNQFTDPEIVHEFLSRN